MIAQISNLSVSFLQQGEPPIQALRNISLDIGTGEILGLVGESGSGKSVLGLSLLGLLPTEPKPQVTGTALVSGVDMVGAPNEQRRLNRRTHLGAVFQDPMTSLNPSMTVGRQVMEVAGSTGDAREMLEAVGIYPAAEKFHSYPHELSGGQRQRVMLAIAVARRPSLVVADEPTTALDVTIQAQILQLLRKLRDQFRCSFLLITHDLGVAAQVCDRITVLYGGRIAETASTETLLQTPLHPYTVGLLRSRLTLKTPRCRPIRSIPGEPPDPRRLPSGCPFAPRCDLRLQLCEHVPPPLTLQIYGSKVACVRAGELIVSAPPTGPVLLKSQPSEERSSPVLKLTDVWKSFQQHRICSFRRQRHWAVKGVTLSVSAGESLAIVGESGSGKSTLLRVVAGITEVDKGTVELQPRGRPKLVFQDAGASLTPWLTVGEQLSEPLLNEHQYSKSQRRAAVIAALADVGLNSAVLNVRPRDLSGGQRQRVALARAIINPPSILLCDEPTSALDVSLAASVLNLLSELRRKLKTAFLFVTHDLAIARLVADRIAVMHLGEIVEIGLSEEITIKPKHSYTKTLLLSLPDLNTRFPSGEILQ